MAPGLDDLRALARSSPWRWTAVRLVVRWHGSLSIYSQPVRAWVQRPYGLRVEHLDGHLVMASWQHPGPGRGHLRRRGGGRQLVPSTPIDAAFPAPALRPDGLVERRPPDDMGQTYDDPMFQSYQWVAMLAPLELADGSPLGQWMRTPEQVPVSLADGADVRAVDHHGREAWEVEAGAPPYEGRWPDAHRVRLDLGTGIVVALEQLGGDHDGTGFDVQVEAMDEPLPRSAFGR